MRPRRAALAVFVLGALATTLAGACRDVVAGSATNLPEELCRTLAECVGACPDDLVSSFEGASEAVRGDFLELAATVDCTGTCSGAKLCRDHAPICAVAGAPCASDEACCRSAFGLAECSGGACCSALGAPCDDSSECCDGATCAANGRCGGVTCTLTQGDVDDEDDARCGSSFECCSHRCADGFCVAATCSSLGEPCEVDADCCSQPGPSGTVQPQCDGLTHTCVDATEACDLCEPVADPAKNCCLASGQVCYVLIDGTSTCGNASCSPIGGDCAGDDDCCQDDVLTYCDTLGAPHCAPLPGCGIAGVTCDGPADCCSGLCLGGQCASAESCIPSDCHSACQLGGPLDPANTSDCDVDATCLQAICDASPSCCCQEWGATCRAKYENLCGACL
ncbi:MAG TPA: hypothetical protein VL400_15280 [Polyangiaceae bacterium]|nr:hypothetical protein [Polyangiaceae bacterium]